MQHGPVRWLVDGNNLMGSRPDGWWRDRPRARRALVAELAAAGLDAMVVFDGHPEPGEIEEASAKGLPIRFAGGGPDAADQLIASVVAELTQPADCTVVTSDAGLAGRVRSAGATVVGVRTFRRQLAGAGP